MIQILTSILVLEPKAQRCTDKGQADVLSSERIPFASFEGPSRPEHPPCCDLLVYRALLEVQIFHNQDYEKLAELR
jgi:hypothetical protein